MAEKQNLPEKRDVGRVSGGRSPHPAYELFVVGELMNGPQHGYKLHAIIQRILGPFHRLSWGTLYPLIRRLEQQGLIASESEQDDTAASHEGHRQTRNLYHLTDAGRDRFFALMRDPGEYSPDYPDLFAVKLSKFSLVDSSLQLAVLQQYREYLHVLREHYARGSSMVVSNPGIHDQERSFILQLADYHIHSCDATLAWLDTKITDLMEQ
ncbi:PadR family transcriptional regulator [Ktedonobacter racemifer]|uniref:Transcriptional regulator, PadR-like family n=1 Tax=Ktedonobacter racemifer DSM 44963 TaxID=485913 RepID=D6TVJ5_KTERA|nr:PadR family transcriptional regulator [Ktedonobacter racemifer]EFH85398.1 transcriptional regulator, PadR-like family [Ktedonobacter racemifer DSM 44963]